jgi:hypothetical protein
MSNNLAISLFITSLFVLDKMSKVLLDGIGFNVRMSLFFLKEFDEREFPFGIQIIPSKSNLRGLI